MLIDKFYRQFESGLISDFKRAPIRNLQTDLHASKEKSLEMSVLFGTQTNLGEEKQPDCQDFEICNNFIRAESSFEKTDGSNISRAVIRSPSQPETLTVYLTENEELRENSTNKQTTSTES